MIRLPHPLCVLLIVVALAFVASCSSSGGPVWRSRVVWAEGVENLYEVVPGIYSGSRPTGDEAYVALRRMGIRTLINVDGAPPDVGAALRNGLRYVHIPVGYDGISRDEQLRLIKAADIMPGDLFIHCHHGRHRGPVAAALIVMTRFDWTVERAAAWIRQAGTSPRYEGLYQTVHEFEPPKKKHLAAIPDDLPASVEPGDLVDAMLQIDDRWRNLRSLHKAGLADHRADAVGQAVLLTEQFRELARTQDSKRKGEDYV